MGVPRAVGELEAWEYQEAMGEPGAMGVPGAMGELGAMGYRTKGTPRNVFQV